MMCELKPNQLILSSRNCQYCLVPTSEALSSLEAPAGEMIVCGALLIHEVSAMDGGEATSGGSMQ